eukprot:TRINITY_DN23912_c0_g1_i4.p4 TRINITY_DN23912_c0_g1~~TRINITY_DN23912_c0_g1_i4.p4  ORF type:complete len:109 (-),score=1.67 TRINITY_DN23912_c0_g1_i4:54-380(-)
MGEKSADPGIKISFTPNYSNTLPRRLAQVTENLLKENLKTGQQQKEKKYNQNPYPCKVMATISQLNYCQNCLLNPNSNKYSKSTRLIRQLQIQKAFLQFRKQFQQLTV